MSLDAGHKGEHYRYNERSHYDYEHDTVRREQASEGDTARI
jgi:hypothetical protein